MFTGFVFNSFCCLSASVFSCAFGSVFTYVMFLFPVVSSVLFSLLYCALMSLFCVPLFLLSVILFAVSFLDSYDTVSAYFPTCVR